MTRIHIGTQELHTDRLQLRKFCLDDAEPMFYNWANDPDVTKFLVWPAHTDLSISESVIKEWVSQYNNPLFYQWAIIAKEESHEPIGSISAVKIDDDIDMVHIGYCIGKKWWNHGITSEALSEVIRFFLKDVGVNRVESRHDPNNPNSGKVMRKCGMRYEGTMRQADRNNQGICDYVMYAILNDDYAKK